MHEPRRLVGARYGARRPRWETNSLDQYYLERRIGESALGTSNRGDHEII
jgi:hypothetical protein